MREIKFRNWNGEKMSDSDEDYDLSSDHSTNLSIMSICGHNLMQFTGLKDKKGVEIYEKDIVNVSVLRGGKDGFKDANIKAEILWIERECKFVAFGEGIYFDIDSTLEVIGNIYENPELIK